jgi:glutaredoxin-related protein
MAFQTSDPSSSARPLLDPARTALSARERIAAFHPETVREVQRALAESTIVVVGMAQNPHVRNVRNALTQAGFEFKYLEYGSYFSKWKERLAIKLWSGWPTFPQVFVKGVLIGGEDLTVAAIRDGSLRKMQESTAS